MDAETYYYPLRLNTAEPVAAKVVSPILVPNVILGSQQLQMISELHKAYCAEHSNISLPDDFLHLALSTMVHLTSCAQSNVLYKLAKALDTIRTDQSDFLLPTRRMPMGLVEYCNDFFSSPCEVIIITT